jgi:predicted SnoaL-like aldol condensation-catalyzing enzyme
MPEVGASIFIHKSKETNMKHNIFIPALLTALSLTYSIQPAAHETSDNVEKNKTIALAFYQDLWFTNNTHKYSDYVSEEYRVHDIGDDKDILEPAIFQKDIADFFWENGDLSGQINYQIGESDLVATRWEFTFQPTTLFGKLLLGEFTIPIINVFRFEEGKIVELWNHRHDIDTGRTRIYFLQGLGTGLLIAFLPLAYAWRLRKKLRSEPNYSNWE